MDEIKKGKTKSRPAILYAAEHNCTQNGWMDGRSVSRLKRKEEEEKEKGAVPIIDWMPN